MSKPIEKFQILLVSPHTSHRSGLRKTLCDLGADNRLIEVAGDFARAKERLVKGHVHLLIADDELSEHERGMDLLDIQIANNQDSKNRIFILMSSLATPFLMADFALKGGDCIISKPFKNDTLIKTISNILKERETMKPEEALVMNVRDALQVNDTEKAQALISSFKNAASPEASFARAILHEAKAEFNEAFDYFARVIEQKPNFKSLVSILKIGMASKKYYELAQYLELWLQKFPIHHKSIPDMTKAIVINNKYGHLEELFQLFSQHKIEDNFAKTSVAAGFVIAATCSFEKGDTEKAKTFALKGIEYSCGRYQILTRAIDLLSQMGEGEAAEKTYNKFCDSDDSVSGKLLELKIYELNHPKKQVLVACQKLLKENVADPELYRITINCMKALGINPFEILALARKHYPDMIF